MMTDDARKDPVKYLVSASRTLPRSSPPSKVTPTRFLPRPHSCCSCTPTRAPRPPTTCSPCSCPTSGTR